jgi:hypothetical protein
MSRPLRRTRTTPRYQQIEPCNLFVFSSLLSIEYAHFLFFSCCGTCFMALPPVICLGTSRPGCAFWYFQARFSRRCCSFAAFDAWLVFFKTGLGPSAFCFGPVGGGFAGSGFAWFGLGLRVERLNFFSSALVESCPDGFDVGTFDLMRVSVRLRPTSPSMPMKQVTMAPLAP